MMDKYLNVAVGLNKQSMFDNPYSGGSNTKR